MKGTQAATFKAPYPPESSLGKYAYLLIINLCLLVLTQTILAPLFIFLRSFDRKTIILSNINTLVTDNKLFLSQNFTRIPTLVIPSMSGQLITYN